MSETPSLGVVGPSYWRYMATVMADRLRELVSKKLPFVSIPPGVLDAAEEFFRLVLESEGGVPSDPPATVANYLIATETLERSANPPPATPEQGLAALRSYAEVLSKIGEKRKLTMEDRKIADRLQQFFAKLQESAEAESYEESVRCVTSSIGLYR